MHNFEMVILKIIWCSDIIDFMWIEMVNINNNNIITININK